MMNKAFIRMLAGLLPALLAGAFTPPAAGGVPEPSITLYGKVVNETGALITSGELVWTFRPPLGGAPVQHTTNLRAVFAEGGPFSYVIEIPAERPVTGFENRLDAIQLLNTPTDYTRSARVRQIDATILDAPTTVSLASGDRGAVERVDLQVAGIVVEPPAAPTNPAPTNGAVGVARQVTLSWTGDPAATSYQLFFWKEGDAVPATPIASNLLVTQFPVSGLLEPATRYNWRVRAQNSAGQTTGDTWTFTTAGVPGEVEETEIDYGDIAGVGFDGTQEVTCSGSASGQDASLILQWYAGLINSLASCPSGNVYVAPEFPPGADVNGDGVLGGQDASEILMFYVGLIDCFAADPDCPPSKAALHPALKTLPWRTIVMPRNLPLPKAVGGQLRVPIFIDSAAGVTSLRMSVDYPANQLQLASVEPGMMLRGWRQAVVNDAPGTVTIVNASPTPLEIGGALVTLVFDVKPEATGGQLRFNAKSELNDGHLATFAVDGSFGLGGMGVGETLAFAKQPKSAVSRAGAAHIFSTQVVNATGAVSYSWTRDGAPIGGDSPTLLLTELEYGDAGTYEVEVSDDTHTIQSLPANLEVVEQLPATHLAMLLLLAAACALAGARRLRRA